MSATRQLNLNIGFDSAGFFDFAWPFRTGKREDIFDPGYFARLARVAHRGRFDAVFFTDTPSLTAPPGGKPMHTADPLTLATTIMAQVPDLGAIVTVSSTYNLPYNLARATQTANLMSQGRLALNIVSTFNPYSAANYSADPLPPREERYARATEFVEILKDLWNSWDERRGVPTDGQFWDQAEARAINYKGAHYTIRGPLNVPRGAHGYPVLAQAGGSDSGIELAARHAEVIYTTMLNKQAGRAFGDKVRNRAAELGRHPGSIRIFPGVVVIIAESREEALRKHELWTGTGSEDGLLQRFAMQHGFELDSFDPDEVLTSEQLAVNQSRGKSVGMQMGLADLVKYERVTAREVVRRTEIHHRLLLGTPEDIADGLIEFWEDGTVDGYMIKPPRAPDDIELFVDRVIPILQDRGVFRREYAGDTLRQRYGLSEPD